MADDRPHFPVTDLKWSRDDGFLPGSQALLNRGPAPETAIIFIHGWGGRAGKTWAEFPAALRAMPEAAQADALFLNYPSKTESVANCAREVKEFLLDILRAPAINIVNGSLPDNARRRDQKWRYSRNVLVGHSMGAVVARRALLDLDREELTPAEARKIRLLFFAPAHLGSSLPALVASGLALDWLPGASLVGQALRLHYRSLADLEEDSDALEKLLKDSEAARDRRKAAHDPDDDLRAYAFHARGDKVVVQNRFDEDHEGRPIAGRNHRNSCKPTEQYRRPVEELRHLL